MNWRGKSSLVNKAPVGIFDSGVGGLSVLVEIRKVLPAESIYYVADSANAPWGDKPPGFVRDRGLEIGRFLTGQGVKAIVIGSNTGTAGSADALRKTLTIPVVGIEPAIKPAVAATKSRVVGAIVPVAVGDSERLASLLDRFGGDVKVITQPVPGLVEHIEAADLDSPELRRMVEGYIRPLLDAGADTIVLGSTHYVFLRSVISEIAGPAVSLIDTGAAVARQLARVLREKSLEASEVAKSEQRFWTSGDSATSERVISALLGYKVRVEKLPSSQM
jgi:glutamate racemase